MPIPSLRSVGTVLRKELVDALRDRRTLLTVLLSAVLLGPLVLVALSALVATLEANAQKREVQIAGFEHAPTLVNFLERQTYAVQAAPKDYEDQLRSGRLSEPLLVVAADFEARLARGEAPMVEVVTDSARARTEAGARRLEQLVGAFGRERTTLALALRGVSRDVLEPVRTEPRDLASAQTRGAQFTGMLPFFVLMAVLYGALNAALDTTAGERERGSLEPLLMNPTPRWTLVVGKWAAVASVAMLIAALCSLGFIPAQWLLRSDTLAALFRYGMREAALFLLVLLPFSAALSALLMAVAIRCRSVKEAQASAAIVVLVVSLLPLVALLNPGAEAPWQLWVPALAQNLLMTRVLKGEAFGLADFAIPLCVAMMLGAAALGSVARSLRTAAWR
jgi:sodium transport system permease protein